MKTGDWITWGGIQFQILAEYDSDYVYLSDGKDGAQLVPVSEIAPVSLH